ncbi:MAG: S-methyl-5-thioribose-1-phosphate isomerase [Candidatus Omnitrophica bacterium]|nr:S-methyl-5-thioribose-1-phosphate isomerase [Candidatus Omnitrophota bacterium]MDD5487638.1 S-methyl-5-thioribose-1-phosphate isomerase [Candidatus Omnitrophota bacterium]
MCVETIRWKNGNVELVDQRLLPARLRYVRCGTLKDIYEAITKMKVRGAPAIGVAGAYGVYLGVRGSKASSGEGFLKDVKKAVAELAGSRPTARNLFWALERMERVAVRNSGRGVGTIKKMLLKEAHDILREDDRICRALGRNGAVLIRRGSTLLTHCNAGGLATASYGTALGVMYSSKGRIKKVYVDETRPVLQGARLTAWELTSAGIPAVLITDNMAASVMATGEIDAVIVGADRIAANGDTANKIGTYNLAVLCAYHKVPFYVAAPASTFDLSTRTGRGIKIEQRHPDEVRKICGKHISVPGIDVHNPSFDVTPAKLITAIITELGLIKRPDAEKIKRTLAAGREKKPGKA